MVTERRVYRLRRSRPNRESETRARDAIAAASAPGGAVWHGGSGEVLPPGRAQERRGPDAAGCRPQALGRSGLDFRVD